MILDPRKLIRHDVDFGTTNGYKYDLHTLFFSLETRKFISTTAA